MRNIDTRKADPLTISVVDHGGRNYRIRAGSLVIAGIQFQDDSVEVNGVTEAALLVILADRLRNAQTFWPGADKALAHIERALELLT